MLDDILEKVRQAGIVGAGGAGFPTSVKLKASPEYIIVNGAECEPLLQVDQQLSAVFAPLLLKTLNDLVAAIGAKGGIFALKEKYKKAAAALREEVGAYPALSLKYLGNYYPMGDEQVLVYEVLGRIVPEGGLPLASGAVVVNVETLLNIAYALADGRPVTEKYVTITGAVKKPVTLKVPVGLKYSDLIAAAGGATVKNPAIINGGPMMGKAEADLEQPVTKTSKGLIVLNADHPWIRAKRRSLQEMMRIAKTACCHCMLCTDLCPRYMLGHRLHPDKIMRLASYNSTCEKEEAAAGAFLCCECGLCEIACIMSLQPWKLNQELKKRLGALGVKNPRHEKPAAANPFRPYRQYPIPKLIQRLGLAAYDHIDAPLADYAGEAREARLLLKQHLGAPCVPDVAVGDEVRKGQAIASPAPGALGACLHSSLDGRVKHIDNFSIVVA
ncbi:MAG: SLBB domain-containing protein [Candidatus Adiutrix sp.]|jgi:Na+-translocating ferredoxin:NAD+ oxidoreductase RnfC subunit|nr:SLBB domain-containing protein [Candidatus Adiutrix sp.]